MVLADPTGELTALHRDARMYPALLARSLVGRLEEASFTVVATLDAAQALLAEVRSAVAM